MTLELSERRRRILKAVIQQYIDTAQPVASQDLAGPLGVSSATVRNELAALEELGLLTHLHTSAGRIPTDLGYRYYVENLMVRTPLSAQEQRTIKHQFYQVRSGLDQWIHLAAAVMARTAQTAAVVTPPRSYESRFKHLELIGINDSTILLILVLHNGTVRQQTLSTTEAFSQDQLSRYAAQINHLCHDAAAPAVAALATQENEITPPLNAFQLMLLDVIVRAMSQFEEQMNELIHHDGVLEMLNHPEFGQIERVREVLHLLQGGKILDTLIPQVLTSEGVQVIIGGEHSRDELRDYSVVLSRYGIDSEVVGVVGVVGPRRMAYPRSISTVRYIAAVMSDLLTNLYSDTKPSSKD